MGKKLSQELRKVGGPPEGIGWIWLTGELLSSPAWHGQSIHCRRLIDFFLQEHLAHNGSENGNLAGPYDQLVAFGVGRRFIARAIAEAEARRLLAVQRGGKRNHVADHLSRYRLTWLASKRAGANGGYYVAAGNEWKRTTEAEMAAFEAEQRTHKKRVLGAPRVNSIGAPVVDSLGAPWVNRYCEKPALAQCTTGEHHSISRVVGSERRREAPTASAAPEPRPGVTAKPPT